MFRFSKFRFSVFRKPQYGEHKKEGAAAPSNLSNLKPKIL